MVERAQSVLRSSELKDRKQVYVDGRLHAYLKLMAQADMRSLSSQVDFIILEAARRRGLACDGTPSPDNSQATDSSVAMQGVPE